MKPFTFFTVLMVAVGGFAIAYLVRFWMIGEPVPISTGGWIALGAVCGFTVVIAFGLVALMIHSHRSGLDDRVGIAEFSRRRRVRKWWK